MKKEFYTKALKTKTATKHKPAFLQTQAILRGNARAVRDERSLRRNAYRRRIPSTFENGINHGVPACSVLSLAAESDNPCERNFEIQATRPSRECSSSSFRRGGCQCFGMKIRILRIRSPGGLHRLELLSVLRAHHDFRACRSTFETLAAPVFSIRWLAAILRGQARGRILRVRSPPHG